MVEVPHALEAKYGLTSEELLDAISRRFRLKVALEGAVAEIHFERKVKMACQEGWLGGYEDHDIDGMHDFTVMTTEQRPIRVEVKTIRNRPQPEVEIQKTRTSDGDKSSRFYGTDKFDVVAVCIGRSTGDWSEFRYAFVRDLPRHKTYPGKIAVMHRISGDEGFPVRWYSRFKDVVDAY